MEANFQFPDTKRISWEVSTLLQRAHTVGEQAVKNAIELGGSALIELDKLTDGCWTKDSHTDTSEPTAID
jgi:hypothetical protein